MRSMVEGAQRFSSHQLSR